VRGEKAAASAFSQRSAGKDKGMNTLRGNVQVVKNHALILRRRFNGINTLRRSSRRAWEFVWGRRNGLGEKTQNENVSTINLGKAIDRRKLRPEQSNW